MTTRIVRTQVTGTSTKKFTLSAWVKKSSNTTGNDQVIFDNYANGSDRMTLYFTSAATLGFYAEKGGSSFNITTNRAFRDVNAWYHIVLRVDTDQGNNAHRSRLYINGTEETSFGTANYASSGFALPMGTSSYTTGFGWYGGGGSSVFEGLMSHLNFIDGEDRTPDYFGETDSTTGEWKIKTTISGVTYGNNGFFILKDGNSLTDQSGENNNFTLNTGTLTKTEDCPSNVFATLNPLDNYYASATYSNGNLSITTDTSKYAPSYSTLGASSGKYYAECKMTAGSSARIGIISRLPQDTGATSSPGNDAYSVGYYSVSGDYYKGSSSTSYGNSYTNGDIIGIAMDLDNNRLFFSKNGTWQNSGDPTSSTGAITIPTSYSGFYHFAVSDQHDGENAGFTWNFGNGYFGTTAVSSAGTNASGLGIFEYDVPSGYTALCTKGLNL